MKRLSIIAALVALCGTAQAKDFAVILTEQERAALIQLIDEAVKSKGLAAAANGVFLAGKIERAPAVEEQKPIEPKKD